MRQEFVQPGPDRQRPPELPEMETREPPEAKAKLKCRNCGTEFEGNPKKDWPACEDCRRKPERPKRVPL